MRLPVAVVRAIALGLMVAAVALSVAVADPLLRVVLVSLALAAGWAALSRAQAPTRVEPAAGWVRPHRRVNQELRTLTNVLLLYVREIHSLGELVREGKEDAAAGEARLAEIQREMGEVVKQLVGSGVPKK